MALKVTQNGSQNGNHSEKEANVTRIFPGKYIRNRKAFIALGIIYSLLLCFMVNKIGIGATASIFLFFAICSLPALLARALGDKSQIADDDGAGGYRYVYSYRYGAQFEHRNK